MTDEPGQRLELRLPPDLQHEPAVGGAEAVQDQRAELAAAQAHRPEVRDDVGHGDDAVEHGDVDVLPDAGAVAVAEGGEHADRRRTSAAPMSPRAPTGFDDRRVVADALELVDAAHRLGDGGEGGPVAVRRVAVAEARHREVDDRGVHGAHVVVAEAEPGHRARLRVLGDDVEPRRQAEHEVAPLGRLEVDADASACRGCCAGTWRRPGGPRGRSWPAATPARARPPRGSTLTTSAPSRASSWVAYGSDCIASRASTRTPSSGLAVTPRQSDTPSDPARRSGGPCEASCAVGALPPPPPPRPHDDRRRRRQGRRHGHPHRRLVRRGRHDAGRRRRPASRSRRRTAPPRLLWFTTTAPPYLDKTNATAVHAALRLDPSAPAFDAVGSVRSTVGALRAALGSRRPGARGRGRPAQRPARQRRRSRPAATPAPPSSSATGRTAARRGARLGQRHRGVPRPLAHARRRAVEAVGGALRRGRSTPRSPSGPGPTR